MHKPAALNWLVPLIAALALITAGTGLFSQGGEGPYTFQTLHGQSVVMYGQGLYTNDSLLVGAGFRGTDTVTLLLSLPLLISSFIFYRRGSLRGHLVLTAALIYFLYNGASMTFAASFNSMFLFYTALFSASIFATITALVSIDAQSLVQRIKPGFPRRGLVIFLIVIGFGTLIIWLSELIDPLMSGTAPEIMGPYTTLFTHGFDSAVITPTLVLAGVSLWKRRPLGYMLAVPLLLFCTLVGVVVIAQTISQALAGLIFSPGIYIGMIGTWVVMGACAIGFTLAYFRNLSETV